MRVKEFMQDNEWSFDSDRVPDHEVIACCFWEYARESSFICDLRKRCLAHYQSGGAWDKQLNLDLEKLQSIGYSSEVFLRGFFCPEEDVLPDAPIRSNETPRLTGSFPNPWQTLTREEREFRAHIRTEVESISLVPFKRGISLDAKEITEWVSRQRQNRDVENERVRRENPNKSEGQLCAEGKLEFSAIRPSLFWAGGKEVTVVQIEWATFTDEEIASCLRGWVKKNRPEQIPAPNRQGKKLSDWRVALNRLGLMRVLHEFTFADHRFPKALKNRGEKHCYAARKCAAKKFRELFPFLPQSDKPRSWSTKGRGHK
jgi:hypothetical protein